MSPEETFKGKLMKVLKKILFFIRDIPKNLLLLLILFYRKCISPLLPPSCRYTPTCSEYAIIAVRRYGFIKGFILAVKRIAKCHPWHEGGYDPVP